jgi:hypothetical protein
MMLAPTTAPLCELCADAWPCDRLQLPTQTWAAPEPGQEAEERGELTAWERLLLKDPKEIRA